MATKAITIPNSTWYQINGKYQPKESLLSIEKAKNKPKIPETKKVIKRIIFQKWRCWTKFIFLILTKNKLKK